MAGEDVPDGDAEGGPRELDENQHGAYMTEMRGKSNVGGGTVMSRRSESAIVWKGIV